MLLFHFIFNYLEDLGGKIVIVSDIIRNTSSYLTKVIWFVKQLYEQPFSF